jgi:hypothetical protein
MRRHPVGLALGGLILMSAARAASRTYVVRVPPGTVARIAAGEEVAIFPQRIELKLSEYDTLVVRNDDSETITIGPYRIEPGQRFVQRYEGPGTFELICSIHGDQGLSIVVTR